jgi:hypothetical protein
VLRPVAEVTPKDKRVGQKEEEKYRRQRMEWLLRRTS